MGIIQPMTTETDRFIETTYWNNRGSYPKLVEELQKLLPVSGRVPDYEKSPALEEFRIAQNFYYDIYNNGLCNLDVLQKASNRKFHSVFDVSARSHEITRGEFTLEFYQKVEIAMDRIILAAAKEQGLYNDKPQAALTEREEQLLAALKTAVEFIEYSKAFENRLTSRNEMADVLKRWREIHKNSTFGIGIGATYSSDVSFDYGKVLKLIAQVEGK
jgi:hypothetical protein